jgi:predicted dehydrogenase
MSDVKKIVLVGAGTMGSHHARVVAQSQRAELTMLVDPRESVGKAIAAKFGSTWVPELPDLDGIDGVIVAAATEAHYPLAMSVLESGTALLVEKPVSDSLLKTQEILALAEQKNLALMCGLLERFNPAIITARSLMRDPFHITATRHSPYASRIKTGVAWDLLVHDVDLAIQLMGANPNGVESRLGFFHPESEAGAEDVVETILEFEGGPVAHISASRVGQRKIRQVSIYESERLIELDLIRRDITVYHHVDENSADGEGRGYRQQTVIDIPELVTSQEPLVGQFEHFLDLIEGTKDAAAERASILPSHIVIDSVTAKRAERGAK